MKKPTEEQFFDNRLPFMVSLDSSVEFVSLPLAEIFRLMRTYADHCLEAYKTEQVVAQAEKDAQIHNSQGIFQKGVSDKIQQQ